ncbi:MAG: hypothetical protein K2R98_27435 [Gemmataceae bacterium]|nr:hypothetical protein [Gemmataceae bacterium]
MLDALLQRFRQHDRLALSRLLSLVSRGENRDEILAAVGAPSKPSRVVALTGAGGVGKSTLIGKLIEHYRGKGQTVAVLACDPQSPLSGGALLGDRFRMPVQPDEGVFIRSLAAVSGRGAVADHLAAMVRVLEAFGFDIILIETAGAGQGDTAAHELADVLVLLLQPEAGDDLQWEKAGVMEVADVVAVHKADLPGAERAAGQVRSALDLVMGGELVPVVRVSSRSGDGVAELAQTIDARPLRRHARAADAEDLIRRAQETVAVRVAALQRARSEPLNRLLVEWQKGSVPPGEAANALLRILADAEANRADRTQSGVTQV